MITNKLKMSIVGVLIAGMVSFSAVNSFAATESLDAKINILSLLQITKPVPMAFGDIEAPINGEVNVVTIAPGAPGGGSVVVVGTAGTPVTLLSSTSGACIGGGVVDTGVILSDIIFFTTDTNTETITITGNGTVVSSHGGTVTVGSGVSPGPKTCAYDITANY